MDTALLTTFMTLARMGHMTRAAAALHVRATPSFFVNGRLLEGAPPVEQFRRVLSIMAGQE